MSRAIRHRTTAGSSPIGLATAVFQQGLFAAAAATLFQKETPAIELLPLGVRIAAKVLSST